MSFFFSKNISLFLFEVIMLAFLFSGTLIYAQSENETGLIGRPKVEQNEVNGRCNTFTFKMKISPPAGEKITIQSIIYLHGGDLLLLSNSGIGNIKTRGWLTRISNSGEILAHKELRVMNGRQVTLSGGTATVQGKVALVGKVSDQPNSSFFTILDAETLQEDWGRIFNFSQPVNETVIGLSEDSLLTVATRCNEEVNYLLANKNGEIKFLKNAKIPDADELVAFGGHYSAYHSNLVINSNSNGLQKANLITIDHSDGNIISSNQLPSGNDEYKAECATYYNGRMMVAGWFRKKNDSFWELRRNLLYSSISIEVQDHFEIPVSINTPQKIALDITGEVISTIQPGEDKFCFVRRYPVNGAITLRAGEISVDKGTALQALSITHDGGYIFGINTGDEEHFYCIKTDSTFRLSGCDTKEFSSAEKQQFDISNPPVSLSQGSPSYTQNAANINFAITQVNTSFDCWGALCPIVVDNDTCLASYYKILRSNYSKSAFGSSFMFGEKWLVHSVNAEVPIGNITQFKSSLKVFNKQGIFEKGLQYRVNGEKQDFAIYPLNDESFLWVSYKPMEEADSVQFTIARMNKNYEADWVRYLRMPGQNRFYSSGSGIADVQMDTDGKIYLLGTTLGYMEPAYITVVKLHLDGTTDWISSHGIYDVNLGTASIQISGDNVLVVAEGAFKGSISLRLNRQSGDALNGYKFNNLNGGIHYKRILGLLEDRLIYQGTDGEGKSLLATFDFTGKPLVFKRCISANTGGIGGSVRNGILTSAFRKNNGNNLSETITQIDSELNPISIKSYSIESNRALVRLEADNTGNFFMAGNTWFGLFMANYVAPYFMKIDPAGNLGTCEIPSPQIQFEAVSLELSTVTPIKANVEITNLKGAPLILLPDSLGFNVAAILCKTPNDCNRVIIEGNSSICDISSNYLYVSKTNAGCSSKPLWIFDTSVVHVVNMRYDSLLIRFKKPGTHIIKSRINTGCAYFEDSLLINIAPTFPSIKLGPDTTLCPGDSILLKAGAGFSGYQWSTGATDSTLWVSTAGKYFVKVDNTCGAPLSDTIEVFMPSVPVLSAGADSSVCMGQPFQRSASDGFANYQWRDISSQQIVSGQKQLSVTAMAGTSYAIEAVTDIGCKRYDTLTLQVISARPFDLGNHVNICKGDTVVFSAPADYAGYLWNSGEITTEIKAWQKGIYKLTVTDNNGCKASDSTAITTVFALPQPALGADQSVCAGSSILLNPGTFARYQWHNGSTQSTFSAFANGMYAVQVWDANGCTKADTMQILAQLPLPTGFLTGTDSICQYEKLELKPIAGYSTYLWSTGSTQPAIQVDKPGIYALKVTDNNNCTGTDTIRVIQKICMEGVYVPNAFTPNNDRINDIFRPMVFGIAIRYEFSVYNRFGERMFVTNDVLKGWDGMYKGQPMPANAYAWMCTYHLEGGEAKVERGMVTLIR